MHSASSPSILIGFKPHLVSCTFTEDYGPIIIHAKRNDDDKKACCSSDSSSTATATATTVNDKPNIRSMSLLHIQALTSTFENLSCAGDNSIVDTSPYEIRIFQGKTDRTLAAAGVDSINNTDASNTSTTRSTLQDGADEQQQQLLDTISQMQGLHERLMDASAGVHVHVPVGADESDGGEIQNFLIRSDAIVNEFLSAIHQHRQRMNRTSLNGNGNGNRNKRKRENVRSQQQHSSIFEYPLAYFDALNVQCKQVDQVLVLDCSQLSATSTTSDSDGVNDDNNSNSNKGRIDLNEELTQITISYPDKSNRTHELIAGNLPIAFPAHGPNWICDLPNTFEPKWMRHHGQHQSPNASRTTTGLAAVVTEFIRIVSTYQTLWDDLDDIDANAWVLEPSLPARRSCMERRLALTSGISVHFALDPDNPRSIPLAMRFIGSSKDMGELRSAYQVYISFDESAAPRGGVEDAEEGTTSISTGNKTAEDDANDGKESGRKIWSEDLSTRGNLERCFGFSLPSPATTEKTDYLVECGVCYAHRISATDDETETIIPNIPCGNSSCGRSYHESCLSEWLHSIPGAKISFGRIFGQCPYCCDSISVKIASNQH
jgi:hypothetical protein